ncbi:hypothetical protein [Rhodopirellula sallentina]|nr:hypothetical protein [Rhodopirellula sallentina]
MIARYSSLLFITTLLISAVGCSPTAPSVANGPPVVTWDHLESESWRYELEDPVRIANYSFATNGWYLSTEGTKRGELHEVSALGGRWLIDDAGDLVFVDESGSNAYERFKLTGLTATTATVVNANTGLTERYVRGYTPR